MRLSILLFALLLVTIEAAAQPVDHRWTAPAGTRVEAQWSARDEDRGLAGHTEHRIEITMLWTADTAIVETGSMAVSVRALEWSFENTEYKLTATYAPAEGLTLNAVPEPGDRVDDDQVRVFKSALEDLIEGRCRVLLGEGGALALRRAGDHGGEPPLEIFSLLEEGPRVPRGGVVSAPRARYDPQKLPVFFAAEAQAPLAVAVEAHPKRGIRFRCKATRRSESFRQGTPVKIYDTTCYWVEEDLRLTCRNRIEFKRHLIPGGIRSASLAIDAERVARYERRRLGRRASAPLRWTEKERRELRARLKVKTLKASER